MSPRSDSGLASHGSLLIAVSGKDLDWTTRALAQNPSLALRGSKHHRRPTTAFDIAVGLHWTEGIEAMLAAMPAAERAAHAARAAFIVVKDHGIHGDPLATRLIELGADLDAVDEVGGTLMHACAGRGLQGAVHALSQRRASRDVPDDNGMSPTALAAIFGHAEILEALIDHGADPRHADKDGISLLAFAAASGKAGCVRLLIALGASLDHEDVLGRTPLIRAVERGRDGAAQALMDAGADPRSLTSQGLSASRAALDCPEAPASMLALQRARALDQREALAACVRPAEAASKAPRGL